MVRPQSPYIFYRDRRTEADDLQWVRPVELVKLTLPRPVVLINGAFDILHANHFRLIAAARSKANPRTSRGTVVCGMDSDAKVTLEKGAGRPVCSWVERATALEYMPIDYLVEIDDDTDMKALVRAIRPDFRVQGSEYRGRPSRFPKIKKVFVTNRGLHTSEIIRRCKKIL